MILFARKYSSLLFVYSKNGKYWKWFSMAQRNYMDIFLLFYEHIITQKAYRD